MLRYALLAGGLLLPLVLHAQGAPPLFTDDTGTAARNTTEWRIIGFLDRRADPVYGELPVLDVGWGIHPRMELAFTAATAHCEENARRSTSVGYVSAGWKWRFYQSEWGAVSTAPTATYFNRSMARECSALYTEPSLFLPVEVQFFHGDWTFGHESGLMLYPGLEDEYSYGFYVGRQVTDRLMVAGEIYGTGALSGSWYEHLVNIGILYEWRLGHTVMLGLGRGLWRRNSPFPDFLLQVAVEVVRF